MHLLKLENKPNQAHEYVLKNSEEFNGMNPSEASKKMLEVLRKKGEGEIATNYSIRVCLIFCLN